MAKAVLKTKQNDASVQDFIGAVKDAQQREDSLALVKLMRAATRAEPRMWGASLIGFGKATFKRANGLEVDWFRCGFSPRKGQLSIHLTCDISQHSALLMKLGKHSTGAGCLYIKQLADVDLKVLKELVGAATK